MSAEGPLGPDPSSEGRTVGEMVFDVSERVSILLREEIELAKTEIREKVTKLVQGSVVGIAAGVFALMGLAMLMHGIAWLLDDLFFSGNIWIGFMVEALFWFCVAAGAGLFAYRSVKAGSPPTPDMAIEEARRTKETLEAGAR
ncbi:MAG: phage holin family protein [Solirubrobacterales bacterium]